MRQQHVKASQFRMLAQGALDEFIFASPRQSHQDALFLDAKVRIEFGGEEADYALRERCHCIHLSGLGGLSGGTREFQRTVMFAGEILKSWVAFHRGGMLQLPVILEGHLTAQAATVGGEAARSQPLSKFARQIRVAAHHHA